MAVVVTVALLITVWSINRSINSLNQQLTNILLLEVQTITKMFEREHSLKHEKVSTNLSMASMLFHSSPVGLHRTPIRVEAENQESGVVHSTNLQPLYRDGISLWESSRFVDSIEYATGASATIFQLIDSGLVRVSTSIRKRSGERATGTYIPNRSPVTGAILSGESYYGRAFVVNEWYTTAYEPVMIDGDIIGALYTGEKEKDMSELGEILSRLTIGTSGYPFVFDKEGVLLIHPYREGEEWNSEAFGEKISGSDEGVITLRRGGDREVIAYRYFDPFELYIAASAMSNIENRDMIRGAVTGAILVSIVAISALLLLLYRFTTDRLYRYLNALERSEEKLASARDALKQSEKLAHMGQVSAGIAHELNNPLGVITMYSNIILDELPEGSDIEDDIKLIAAQAERCKKIVGGLLNFARKSRVKPQSTDIVRFLHESINNVVVPDNIEVSVRSEESTEMAAIDREQMMQVFTNIMKNGIEAMTDGGRLTITVSGKEESVVISIADTGKGIEPENMEKLFTPFFTTKRVGKGTGLGLALVYGVVKMHKGKIDVRSNSDRESAPTGTEFIITLPRKGEESDDTDI